MNLSICLRAPLLGASLLGLAAITALPPLAAAASPREPMPAMGRMQAPHMEPQREPRGYTRFRPPPAIERRPPSIDRGYYGHHFLADRAYRIGPYHAPPNFVYRRWVIGAILPPLFWGRDYWLTDYWLFGLDIPPVGYEWVRYGPDALLIDVDSGEVVQVVYGIFG